MTQEDIIRMAREAGSNVYNGGPHFSWVELERFAKLVAKHTMANVDPSSFMSYQEGWEAGAAAEREACAKVCEEIYTGEEACGDWPTPEMCAEAIRARALADRGQQ